MREPRPLKDGCSEDGAHNAAKAVWNKWAIGITPEQDSSTIQATTFRDRTRSESRDSWRANFDLPFRQSLNFAKADFSRVIFVSELNMSEAKPLWKDQITLKYSRRFLSLSGFVFPGEADFTTCSFFDFVAADDAMFYMPAWFRAAEFRAGALFERATFQKDAYFQSASFVGEVRFSHAKFLGVVDFGASNARGVFDLSDARFARVPIFNQASFDVAQDLDNISLPRSQFFHRRK